MATVADHCVKPVMAYNRWLHGPQQIIDRRLRFNDSGRWLFVCHLIIDLYEACLSYVVFTGCVVPFIYSICMYLCVVCMCVVFSHFMMHFNLGYFI